MLPGKGSIPHDHWQWLLANHMVRGTIAMPRLKKKYMQPEPVVIPAPVVVTDWPAFMDYHTAAKYISETYWTIRNLVKAGKLTAKKLGRRNTVSRTELDVLWKRSEAA
jgi:excisionase family DNA binding protein